MWTFRRRVFALLPVSWLLDLDSPSSPLSLLCKAAVSILSRPCDGRYWTIITCGAPSVCVWFHVSASCSSDWWRLMFWTWTSFLLSCEMKMRIFSSLSCFPDETRMSYFSVLYLRASCCHSFPHSRCFISNFSTFTLYLFTCCFSVMNVSVL